MSESPGDILEDVWEAAVEAAREAGRIHDAAIKRGSPAIPMVAFVIASAILTERERCAKVAYEVLRASVDDEARNELGAYVAKAIRNPSPPESSK